MRVKNQHAAPLAVGSTSIEPGAEGEVDGNHHVVKAWLSAGLLLDVTPLTIDPPAPPALDPPSAANDTPRGRKG